MKENLIFINIPLNKSGRSYMQKYLKIVLIYMGKGRKFKYKKFKPQKLGKTNENCY